MTDMTELPKSHEPYTDKYFLRSKEVLQKEGLNPFIRAQLFIRQGPGNVYGINDAVDILRTYSNLEENGGRIYALNEGAKYASKETIMVLEGRAQDIIDLETMILGVISAQTTKHNDHHSVDLDAARETMRQVVAASGNRPVSYFGARHWSYDEDEAIAKAAFDGGASSCSTDIGAQAINAKGIGTIPHALENIFAYIYGQERAVVESTKSFDRHIDPAVPRISLIDYRNREVDDTLATAQALEGRLAAVRIDTCGENVAQGALAQWDDKEIEKLTGKRITLAEIPTEYRRFWTGKGVTVTGTYAVRTALDTHGHSDVEILLSSGFGDPVKVRAFADAEKRLGVKLFDGLGVGGIYDARITTMDIVAVGETLETLTPMSKVGRPYRPNARVQLRMPYDADAQHAQFERTIKHWKEATV